MASAATLYTFDSAGELASDFTTTGTALSQSASGGINNTGALQYSTGDANGMSTVLGERLPVSFASDFALTQSTFFKTSTRTQFGRNNRQAIQLGLTEATTTTYSAGGLVDVTALSGGLFVENYNLGGTGNPTSMRIEFWGSTSLPNNNFSVTNLDVDIPLDAWYFLSVDYIYSSSSDEWTLDWTLNEATSAGVVGLELASTSSGAAENPFGANPDIHGYVGTFSAERTNVALLDNISLVTVPEPTTAALIFGGVSLLVWRRRAQ